MQSYAINNGRLVKRSADEALAAGALLPGEFARRLYSVYGLARRFAPIGAWFVNVDTVSRCQVIEVRGADCEYLGAADYALTVSGLLLPTLYLFPADRHLKPRLLRMEDGMGHFTQWAAPLKPRCLKHWG